MIQPDEESSKSSKMKGDTKMVERSLYNRVQKISLDPETNGRLIYPFYFSEVQGNSKLEKELKVTIDTKNVKSSPYYKDKVLSLPISKKSRTELWQHWTDQAFSGLISAIATRR